MRQRLEAARAVLIRTTSEFTEADAVLEERRSLLRAARQQIESAPENARVAAEVRRVERGVAVATEARAAAARKRKDAATRLVEAQSDFDSTRDGLTELRAALDGDPGNEVLVERYHEARGVYEDEAARRERAYGHQAPLSLTGISRSGALGRTLSRLGTTAWIKGASTPDTRSGLYEHRINLVRRNDGTRRSATVPFLSEHPLGEPVDGGPRLAAEPLLAEVCQHLESQVEQVRSSGASVKKPGGRPSAKRTSVERHQWRASVASEKALSTFLR